MARGLKIGIALMLTLAAVSLAYFFDVAETVRSTPDEVEEEAFAEPEEPLYEPTDPPVEVKIFFPGVDNRLLLRTRDRTIFASAEVANQARQIVEHLIAGADDPMLYGRLPEGTRLNQIFISEGGTAYLDFNSALSDNHPGGVLPEQATIYAIVNSLTYNLDAIDRVKILIGGVEKETLAGHTLLLLPLEQDLSISDIAPVALSDALSAR